MMRSIELIVLLFIASVSGNPRVKRFLFGPLFGGMSQAPQQSYYQQCIPCTQSYSGYNGGNYGGNYGGYYGSNQGGGWAQPTAGGAQPTAGGAQPTAGASASPGFSVSPQQAVGAFVGAATLIGAANQFANNQNHHRAPVVVHPSYNTQMMTLSRPAQFSSQPSPSLRAAAASAVNAAFAAAVAKAGGKSDDSKLPEWLRNELIYQAIRNSVGNPFSSFSGLNSAGRTGTGGTSGVYNRASEVVVSRGSLSGKHTSTAYAPGKMPGPPGLSGGSGPPGVSSGGYATPPPPSYVVRTPSPSPILSPPSSALYLTPPPKTPSYIPSNMPPPPPPPKDISLPPAPPTSYAKPPYMKANRNTYRDQQQVPHTTSLHYAHSHRESGRMRAYGFV